MNFVKSSEENDLGEIIMRRGCISCGFDDLFGGGEVEDDGGASSDGGSNK